MSRHKLIATVCGSGAILGAERDALWSDVLKRRNLGPSHKEYETDEIHFEALNELFFSAPTGHRALKSYLVAVSTSRI
jgi:putative intracellular protease/amidase